MHMPDPTFPPLLTGHPIKGAVKAYETAQTLAMKGEAGAGDVFWARSTDILDIAVVLEPEVDRSQAIQMMFAAMVAFGDSLGAIGPPELGLYYVWPGGLLVNGATAGQVRVALPDACRQGGTPDWMVIGITVNLRVGNQDVEPGDDARNTNLLEEGCGDITRTQLVESLCRHFLVWINTWEHEGFKPIHEIWVGRCTELSDQLDFTLGEQRHRGTFVGLDESGDLLMRPEGGDSVVSISVLDCVDYATASADQ